MNKDYIINVDNKKDKEALKSFFNYIKENYGEEFPIPDNHLENIISKKMYNELLFEYYLDTYTTLSIMEDRNVDELLEIEKEDLLGFHHNLTKKFKVNSDLYLIKQYEKQLEDFINLSIDTDDYIVSPIKNLKELDWEGKYMNHCISTYRYKITDGDYVAFKFYNKKSWERLTLGFNIKNDELIFNQLKAHSNFPASKESREMVIDYCNKLNLKFDKNNYDLRI